MIKLHNQTANYTFGFFLILIAIFYSCIDDYRVSEPENGIQDNGTAITMTFQLPKASSYSGAQTRAISQIDENRIEDIDVLAFKKEGDQWVYMYKAVGTNIIDAPNGSNGNKKQFKVEVKIESFEQQFVVVANARQEVETLDWNILVGTEKNELLKKLIFKTPLLEKWKATGENNFRLFPMWGEAVPKVIDQTTKSIPQIKVLRGIASVDVIAEAVANEFTLTDIYIYNTKASGYVVPLPENIDMTNLKPTHAQVPNGPHNDYDPTDENKHALKYHVPANASNEFEREIYLMEAMAISEKESKEVTDDERYKATCLIIGGIYDGAKSWYRVDLFSEEKDSNGNITSQKYRDFLRNHQYRFNISEVSGPGYPEPEIALKEKSINLLVEIKEWDDGKVGDIVFDGQHYISFDPSRELLFGRYESLQNLKIKTDVLEGFKITEFTDVSGNKLQPEDLWFTMGDFELNKTYGKKEKEEIIPIKVTENTTDAERTVWMYVEAGRMRVKVVIKQSNAPLYFFKYISMKNINGKELSIPSEGGKILIGVESNISWTLKAKRGDMEVSQVYTPVEEYGEILPSELTLDIQPLTYLWKQDLDAHEKSDIDVWIEYELNGETIVTQQMLFHQVPYDIKSVTPPSSINKYGEFLELELKGYFPKLPIRVVDGDGEVVSDMTEALATGSLLDNDNLSTKIKFLVYSNYSGDTRTLTIQFKAPTLKEGKSEEWKTLLNLPQEYNEFTLPTDGFKASRGVLGIGAKTGKLRLDGSNGLLGGTATYIDKDGVEQPEDVYVVSFKWGSLFGLRADRESNADILIQENKNTIIGLKDIIVWLPPGYKGDIDNLPIHPTAEFYFPNTTLDSYHRIPAGYEEFFPAVDNLVDGIGDPCRQALNKDGVSYGSFRMPWGSRGGPHEAIPGYASDDRETRMDNDFAISYFTYEYLGEKNYLPALGAMYNVYPFDPEDEGEVYTGDEGKGAPHKIIYNTNTFSTKPGSSNNNDYLAFWTVVSFSGNQEYVEAFELAKGSFPWTGVEYGYSIPKYVAMPIRCVK